jgi:hypothetical protein
VILDDYTPPEDRNKRPTADVIDEVPPLISADKAEAVRVIQRDRAAQAARVERFFARVVVRNYQRMKAGRP